MPTVYEVMRPGSKNQWRRKKKQLRRMGLKRGEWFDLSIEALTERTIREGMTVQNTTGRPALFKVVTQMNRMMLLNLKTQELKELDNPRKYKWVSE